MMDNTFTDAAQDGAAYLAQAAGAHDDHVGVDRLAVLQDLVPRLFGMQTHKVAFNLNTRGLTGQLTNRCVTVVNFTKHIARSQSLSSCLAISQLLIKTQFGPNSKKNIFYFLISVLI